ncbi:hypothetical protein TWF569_007340 [Orbilia oligospora]|uniref:Uncharacterized protein n=1 Tax=Orbilia oligospora TaxID=2813651 RepID=A0A7C8JQT9_ORBOL|nr:hypothetical protein TWF706_006295 [Orbilia oligospora]KAF3108620.1 hypothetical protein TWF102_010744 [Orbilia oligospora]KAF3111550.1 hypothetical protein TWF103_003496 [Orbilia oligospora]KAF3136114.1 hypothetical protein TWF703_005759 [Orbilia oligospora]KAF3143250.1 hypothetical protein TWF569_007340 [Orbilia oligospora]
MGKPQQHTFQTNYSTEYNPVTQAFQAEDIYNVLQHVSSNRRTMNPQIFGSSMFTRDVEGGEYAQFYSHEEEKYFYEIDQDLKYLESLEASNPAESTKTTDECSSAEWSIHTEAANSNINLTTQTRATDLCSGAGSEHRYPRVSSRKMNWL